MEQEIFLGSAEIRVEIGGHWLAAPDLVYHYVTDHAYLPPIEFIDAVIGAARKWRAELAS